MLGLDTRIVVQGMGYVRVDDIRAPFGVWTGEGIDVVESISVEPSEAYLVRLLSGVEMVCSWKQNFKTRIMQNVSPISKIPVELNNSDMLYTSDNVFEFDYLPLSCYKYLYRINSQTLGTLLGLIYCLRVDSKTLDIPKVRREAYRELERIFKLLQIEYAKEEYYKRADRVKYTIEDAAFLSEINPFLVKDSIPEVFWKSKTLLKGFLKSVFTFSIVGTNMLTIRAKKDSTILKDIQQALLLFGINSTYSRGLKMSQLVVFKNNAYRLANNIQVFNAENLFEGLDFMRFIEYKDNIKKDMKHVKVLDAKPIGMRPLVGLDVAQVMANGVILENYGRR
jgi:hypothetical protein